MKTVDINPPNTVTPTQSKPSSIQRALEAWKATSEAPQAQASPTLEQAAMKAAAEQPNQIPSVEQATTPVSEAIETPPVSEAKPQTVSPQFEQLARREAALRKQMQQFKAERDAYLAERNKPAQQQPTQPQVQGISPERLKADPFGTLLEHGLSYDQLTEMLLNGKPAAQVADPAAARIAALEAKIEELKQGQESTKKSFEDSQKHAYDQAVANIRAQTKQLVSTDPAFETIKEMNYAENVVKLIVDTYEQDGKLMTVEEACSEVENYLIEEATRIAKLKKVQQRLAPAPAAATPSQQPQQSQPVTRTLTNVAPSSKPMTSLERAIAAFNGNKI